MQTNNAHIAIIGTTGRGFWGGWFVHGRLWDN